MTREEIMALIGALICLTAMVASLKVAGVLSWSWWWVLTPPVLGVAGIVWMVNRK